MGVGDAVGRRGGDVEPLGVRVLVALQRRHAGVERDRRDADAVAHESGDQLGGERPGRARHLGGPRLLGEDGLVGVDRPGDGDVLVADRPSVAVEVGEDLVGEVQLGDREAGRRLPGGQPVEPRAVGEGDALAGDRATERLGRAAGEAAHLDQPGAVGQRCGQVDGDGFAVRQPAVERGGDGGGRVDHQQVAGEQVPGQVGDPGVDRLVEASAHQQPDVVAGPAGGLGRFVRLQLRWEDEVQDDAVVGRR